MVLFPLAIAHAACEGPVSPGDVGREVARTEEAWLALDLDAFAAGGQQIRAAIPCLDAPVGSDSAAGWHRIEALQAVTVDDWNAVTAALRSVLAADPAWRPSDALMPVGNPTRDRFEAARLAGPGAVRSWRAPAGSTLYVDGLPRREVPVERPYVAQLLNSAGRVLQSEILVAGATPSGLPGRSTLRPVLAWSAAGAGVAALGVYGVALGFRAEFDDPATAYADLDRLEASANGSVYGAAALGALAVGLGAVSLTVDF